ncbi:MAG: hypothetical protein C4521_00380 [Actinobacteria bacterium]|nr:MAG: hypothetical protein C4521_00380 [Actinomycetota bacterium]
MNRKHWIGLSIVVLALVLAVATFFLLAPRRTSENGSGWDASDATRTPDPTTTTAIIEPTGTIEETSSQESSATPRQWSSAATLVFQRDGALWAAREDGTGKETRLLSFSDTGTYLLSPDRTLLAFTTSKGEQKPLFVAELATGKVRKLAETTRAKQGQSYAWSPEGERLAYTVPVYRRSALAGENIYSIRADGAEKRLVVKQGGSPVWGPDEWIAFRRTDFTKGTWRLFMVKAEGGPATAVPASNRACAYSWSPKRPELVFAVAESEGKVIDGVVRMLRRGERVPQTVLQERLESATYTEIVWSPDGRQIAVGRSGDDGYSRVRVIDLSGKIEAWEVNADRDVYPACWSVDGSRLLYFEGNAFQGAPSNLWCVRRSGTSRRVVIDAAAP